MTKPLADKTVLVTGASAGIGRATALKLVAEGAAVAVNARRRDRLDELVAEIEAMGGKALAVEGDAASQDGVDSMLERVLAWDDGGNKYDSVVVNAGRGLASGMLESDESQWEDVYTINVMGAAKLMRRAAHYMMGRKAGDIVVLSSVVGRNISPFSGFYGSSKFAVSAMAEGLRREVCSHGVRVSIVLPGLVLSEFQGVAGYGEEFQKTIEAFGTPLQPEDIAEAIRWLLALPAHVNINEVMVRPTGQAYP
jgi:NADP-dependent 3-hydroxy acid dehydrogenase YdfG